MTNSPNSCTAGGEYSPPQQQKKKEEEIHDYFAVDIPDPQIVSGVFELDAVTVYSCPCACLAKIYDTSIPLN